MSKIENFLTSKSKSFYYYLKLFINNIGVQEEIIDRSWIGIKTKSTYLPNGWSKDGCFNHLNKEYTQEFTSFKRY